MKKNTVVLLLALLICHVELMASEVLLDGGIGYFDIQDTTLKLNQQAMGGQLDAMKQYISYTGSQMMPGMKENGIGYYYDDQRKELVHINFYRFLKGAPRQTMRPLDLKVDGKGFFVVEMPGGWPAFTHDGRFELDDKKRLVMMSTGFPVLGVNGYIFLRDNNIVVTKSGEILQNEKLVDKLRIEWFTKQAKLNAFTQNLFYLSIEDYRSKDFFEKPKYEILQGFIEQSSIEQAHVGRIEEWSSGQQANVRMMKAYLRNLSSAVQAGAPL